MKVKLKCVRLPVIGFVDVVVTAPVESTNDQIAQLAVETFKKLTACDANELHYDDTDPGQVEVTDA